VMPEDEIGRSTFRSSDMERETSALTIEQYAFFIGWEWVLV
jgi:hypothetical protein